MYQGKVKNESEGSLVETMPKMCSFQSSLPFCCFLPVHTKTLKVLHVLVYVCVCFVWW